MIHLISMPVRYERKIRGDSTVLRHREIQEQRGGNS